MCLVMHLRHDEPLRLDSERLADMFVDLGETRAANLIALSVERLEELIADLNLAAAQYRANDCLDLARQIRALGDILGLLSLAAAAKGVCRAVQSGDKVALAATLARLKRVAHRSFRLTEDLRHRSG